MYKLGEIYRLEKLVSHGEVTVDEALEFIDRISAEKDFYPRWTNPLAYALASFCTTTMFFGGQWKDAGVAACLGSKHDYATREELENEIITNNPHL